VSLLKNILKSKSSSFNNGEDFWVWFEARSDKFYRIIETKNHVVENFLDLVLSELHKYHPDFYVLAGMTNDGKAELIISAESDVRFMQPIRNFVKDAPSLSKWKFTALKPRYPIADCVVEIGAASFDENSVWFVPNVNIEEPDCIDLTFFCNGLLQTEEPDVIMGGYIFLEHLLGEEVFATMIDELKVEPNRAPDEELIPINKLETYLTWRQKEFEEQRSYATIDYPIDALTVFKHINTNVSANMAYANWIHKPMFPWMVKVVYKYPKDAFLIQEKEFRQLLEFIKEMKTIHLLSDFGEEETVYLLASANYQELSVGLYTYLKTYNGLLTIEYSIFKDKYWSYCAYLIP